MYDLRPDTPRSLDSAVADGVDLRGYLAWSVLDDVERAFGNSKRFGIVRVDYDTQERTGKDGARWYAQVVRDNGS